MCFDGDVYIWLIVLQLAVVIFQPCNGVCLIFGRLRPIRNTSSKFAASHRSDIRLVRVSIQCQASSRGTTCHLPRTAFLSVIHIHSQSFIEQVLKSEVEADTTCKWSIVNTE